MAVTPALHRSIEDLLTAFGRHADRGDGDALAALFTEDGSLTLGEAKVTGRQAIAAFTNERCADAARKTRHVWSNLLVEPHGENAFTATCIQQTFEQVQPQPASVRVNDVEDYIRAEKGGDLRFVSRRLTRQLSVAG